VADDEVILVGHGEGDDVEAPHPRVSDRLDQQENPAAGEKDHLTLVPRPVSEVHVVSRSASIRRTFSQAPGSQGHTSRVLG